MEWYYADEADQQVSFEEENFKGLIDAGAIKPDTLVWNSTMPDWKKASLVQPVLFGPGVVAATAPGSAPPSSLPPSYGGGMPAQQTDGLGVAAMVCGILSILMTCGYGIGIFPGIAAIICGHMSKKKTLEQGTLPVSGVTTAGLVMGYIGSALNLLIGIFMIVMVVIAISAEATTP